ncbi:MAG: DNA cytosine methyltransferase [Deltaproteobacteria bacterium]|nr:DNA cytosine methyltransferase [Deltaproteobacteria bacterium]
MQYDLNFNNELIVDNFAGGGGASIGIEKGANRFVDIAINHDEKALNVHELNHPHTKHIKSDVYEVDILEECEGDPIGFAWFSPDCRYHSKAKGGKPVNRHIRGLAWVIRKYAKLPKNKRPRVITFENVEEFLNWGPLIPKRDKEGNVVYKDEKVWLIPDPKRKGLTFWAFNQWFLRNGYKTEWRILKACDYGAPTIRKRLFWIARCDGEKIVWPEPSHAPKDSIQVKKKKLKPYRTASECIDFSIPCPSIFMDKKEVKVFNKKNKTRIKRPLADATLKRIAKGIVKYVINEQNPFIVQTGYGERKGQSPRAIDINNPLGTIVAGGVKHAVCTPYIARQFGQSIGHNINEPTGSITAGGGGKTQLVAPIIARQFKSGVCHSVENPLATIMAAGGGGKNQLVSAFLAKHYTGVVGSDLKNPLGTITSVDHHSLVTATLSQDQINKGAEKVTAFLIKYYGQSFAQGLKEPLHTLSTKDRFGLVTVHIKGEPWVIVDIGIRMLQPEELKLAQGFPKDYNLGDNTKTTKVRLIGNSVPPPFAEAIVRSNYNTLNTYRKSA